MANYRTFVSFVSSTFRGFLGLEGFLFIRGIFARFSVEISVDLCICSVKLLILLVGETGFEPTTSASRRQRSTRLSYTPTRWSSNFT